MRRETSKSPDDFSTDESNVIREAGRIIRAYPNLNTQIELIERRRPSLLKTLAEIDSQEFRDKVKDGSTGFGERDAALIKTFLWNVWAADVMNITLNERATRRDAEVFRKLCIEKSSASETAQCFGISKHTVERIRVKIKGYIAEEIRLRWSLNRSYLDFHESLSSETQF